MAANGGNGSATGNGQVTINSGGVLASDPILGGTIGGNVLAGSGATIAPSGIGSIPMTIGGNLTLNNQSTLDFGFAGFSADELIVNGSLSVTGSVNLVFAGPATNTPYTLATFNNVTQPNLSDFIVPPGYTLGSFADYPNQLELVSAPSFVATWAGSNGSWADGTKWNTLAVPSGQGVAAIVGTGTTTPVTITLESSPTLGTLTLANSLSAATGYTLAIGSDGGYLTMDNTGGTAATAQIFVVSGSHTISAPVALAGALSIDPSVGTTLVISGTISEETAGAGSLLLDGPGTLVLGSTTTNTANTYSGGTSVTAGTLIVMDSAALRDGSNLTVGAHAATFFAVPAAGAAAASSSPAVAAVPEPGTLALLTAAGIVAAAAARRRRRREE